MKFTIILLLLSSFSCSYFDKPQEDVQISETFVLKHKYDSNSIDVCIARTKEIVTILSIIITLICGIPLLSKTLREDHIKKLLLEIQESNKETYRMINGLLDETIPLSSSRTALTRNELQSFYLKIKDVKNNSLTGSQEIISLLYYIEIFLRNLLRQYEKAKYHNIQSIYYNEFYSTISDLLAEVAKFSKMSVTIPENSKLTQVNIFPSKIYKYFLQRNYRTYKHLPLGIDDNILSPLAYIFYKHIYRSNNSSILRAALQVSSSHMPLLRIVTLNKLYIPSILVSKSNVGFIPDRKLYLSGYNVISELDIEKGESKKIKATYVNCSNYYHFVESIVNKNNFFIFDDPILDIKFKKPDNHEKNSSEHNLFNTFVTFLFGPKEIAIEKYSNNGYETISVHMDYNVARKIYSRNKYKLIRIINKELKENR